MKSRDDGMWWGTTIQAPDPIRLARFYGELVGWRVEHETPETAIVSTSSQGPPFIVFQRPDDRQAAASTAAGGRPRPKMHFDFQVGDLQSAATEAVALGATLVASQPDEYVRVLLDPAGHTFCLCIED